MAGRRDAPATMCPSLTRRHGRIAPTPCVLLALALAGPGIAAVAAPAQAPAAGAPSPVSIDHQAPGCAMAGKHPRVGACFQPPAALARARVYFRAGGTADWFYVEMAGAPPCLEGTLPRPKKSLARVEYYVAATDRSFGESRTPERALVVTSDGRCSAGPVAPFVDTASVIIGSISGAAPVGFVTGAALSPLLIAGGVAVVGGGTAAIVAGGGEGESPPTTVLPPTTTTTTTSTTSSTTTTTTTTTRPPDPPTPTTTTTTTTTLPPPTTTTTTTLPPPTTTTTTTTTTLPPCDTVAPNVRITNPSGAGDVGGIEGSAFIVAATASDSAPGFVKEVRFAYCQGTSCNPPLDSPNIGTDTTEPYQGTWLIPQCSEPGPFFTIGARAEDNCGNRSVAFVSGVKLVGRIGCLHGPGSQASVPSATGAWTSTLSLPDGRGQVIVDGTQAVFPGPGTEAFSAPAGSGAHRFEATLVNGASRPGTWRFDLSALGVAPGTLRVVAGEAALAGPSSIAFRLRGKPGERVVFTFETAPAP